MITDYVFLWKNTKRSSPVKMKRYCQAMEYSNVRQAEKLMNNLVSEIKEFVKGGEFEKIHRNETRTRDRDELSR